MGKGVFIGLGGSGVNTVGHLRAKLLERHSGNETELAKDCRFLFIDTDDRAIRALNTTYKDRVAPGTSFIRNNDQRVDLGDVNPLFVWRQARGAGTRRDQDQERLLSWIDESGVQMLKDIPLRVGAGANRQQGRIAVWQKWSEIRNKLSTALTVLSGLKNNDQWRNASPTFYIVGSTCGGTGSSAFLDVAYLLDRLVRDNFGIVEGDPPIRFVLFMPHWYVQLQREKDPRPEHVDAWASNGFAFFDELNALLVDKWVDLSGRRFASSSVRHPGVNPAEDHPFPVFSSAFCIDDRTERGFSLGSDEDMYRNTAEVLFYWHTGTSAAAAVISGLDNTQQRLLNSKEDEVPAFFTIGYRALQFPDNLMVAYLRTRLTWEALSYGLLGENYEPALPDTTRRDRHFKEVFGLCFAQHLFEGSAGVDLPNLERDRRVVATQINQTLGLERFKRPGKDRIDPDLVADEGLLTAFESEAEMLIVMTDRALDEAKREGAVSDGEILRAIQTGVRNEQTRVAGLEDHIEDNILQFGIRYTLGLLDRLDTYCEFRALEFQKELDGRMTRLGELDAEIADAKKDCLAVRSGKKEGALTTLHAKLSEKVRLRADITLIRQQIALLQTLSLGQKGILDAYETVLTRYIEFLTRSIDEQMGWKHQYEKELPKRFQDTSSDVTTAYLPPVESFVADGRWAPNHDFSRMYEQLVPQEQVAGGSQRPKRAGADFGWATAKDGLHAFLWFTLTDAAVTGRPTGYEHDGHLQYFRLAFGTTAPWEPERVIRLLVELLEKAMDQKVRVNKTVNEERHRSLLDRLKNLPVDDLKTIVESFSDTGTQVFCLTAGHTGTVYSVFAGADRALAEALGYDPANTAGHQFVEHPSLNRMVRLKVVDGFKLSQYDGYSSLQNAYSRVRNTSHVPHIHTLFKRYGTRQGLRMAAANIGGQEGQAGWLDMFASLILWREIVGAARGSSDGLLSSLLDVDDTYLGHQRRLVGPLVIEDMGASYRCRVVSEVEVDGDRLRIPWKSSIHIEGIMNYHDLYLKLKDRGLNALEGVIQFDDLVTPRLHYSWTSHVDSGVRTLTAKLQALVSDPNSTSSATFFGNLHDAVRKAGDRIGLATRKGGAARPPSPGDAEPPSSSKMPGM